LRDALEVEFFVNADVIAHGLSGLNPSEANSEAGIVMIRRLIELADRKVDFAFETTLSSRNFATPLADWKAKGYLFHLVYLWLPSTEHAIQRVKDRVRRGGHNVPDEDVRRRYLGGLRNLFSLYRPLADTWRFFDSSSPVGPRLVAFGTADTQDIFDYDLWDTVLKQV
jgi:predicted ABC-type ATPase